MKNKVMKKFILPMLFFSCSTWLANSQGEAVQFSLAPCRVVNPVIFQALDSLSVLTSNCVFFKLDKTYYYRISIEDNGGVIFTETRQYDWSLVKDSKSKFEKGYFYYKGVFVFVETSTVDNGGLFVFDNDSLKDFIYEKNITLRNWYLHTPESTYISFRYDGKTLRREYEKECYSINYINEKLETTGDWEELSEEFHCPAEDLEYIDGKYVGTLPVIGDDMNIIYEINEKGDLSCRRVSTSALYGKKKRLYNIIWDSNESPIFKNNYPMHWKP